MESNADPTVLSDSSLATANQKREQTAKNLNKESYGIKSLTVLSNQHAPTVQKLVMMGNSAILFFAFLRLSFMKMQNGLFRGKERYVNTLKISDCQAFSPIRTVGLRDLIPSKLTAITEVLY